MVFNKLFDKYTSSNELELQTAISSASKYLTHDKKVLNQQKKQTKETSKLINNRAIEYSFDKYTPEIFDELIKYIKNSSNDKNEIYENLYLQNIPKGIIDNAYAWINLSKLKHKSIKKYIKNDDFKIIKKVLKQDLGLGFRLYDLHDKLVEKGWSIELVNKLVRK